MASDNRYFSGKNSAADCAILAILKLRMEHLMEDPNADHFPQQYSAVEDRGENIKISAGNKAKLF